MNKTTLRILVPLVVLLVVAVGFAGHGGIGNLSAFGWREIALLCPVGALTSMLAAKIMMPRAVVSLVIVIILILLFGRTFCGWICSVPVIGKIADAFKPKSERERIKAAEKAFKESTVGAAELTDEEKKLLSASCGSCAERHGTFDSRHLVLGGAILSATIFGFPVFCLVCPVGLSFATVFLLIRAFGFGDVSWTLVIVPLFLVVEVLVFKKWCHTFCPISALMSLVALGNRTFKPSIDDSKCLETSRGVECSRCSQVCAEGIDPRHLLQGNGMNECTRCMECVDACPSGALRIATFVKNQRKDNDDQQLQEFDSDARAS